MCAVVTLTCLFALQQLHVDRVPAEAGRAVVVRAANADGAPAVVEVTVTLPGGDDRALGRTDASGALPFTAEVPGLHTFAAEVDGVRCVAPVTFGPSRQRLWLLFGSAPLGLALLWLQLRRLRGRRASDAAAS